MTYAIHFAGVLAAGWLTAYALTGARWTWREPYGGGPAAALLRVAGELAAGRLPARLGAARLVWLLAGLAVAAGLLGATLRRLVRVVRAHRRHRALLALVAREDPALPGALVVDHPGAAAYCLPGIRPCVVVSAGTIRLLDDGQLAAVLSHERAHAHERHDLVVLPFSALCRALPWVRRIQAAHEAVALLVEMCADDRARREHAEAPLVGALLRFAAAPASAAPPGAQGATPELQARVDRLLSPYAKPPLVRGAAALLVAQGLVAVPLGLFLC